MTSTPQTAAEYRKQVEDRARKAAVEKRVADFMTHLIFVPLVAFVLMLAIGAVHGFAPAVPALGYWTTILLVLGADALADLTKKFRN